MTFQLPDDNTFFGKSVRSRLQDEYLIWLTAVDTRGMPQPAPVWFWWDEAAANFLVYNLAHARRLDFVRQNSQVALHFNGYPIGSGIIVFAGHAQLSTAELPADQHQLYLAKYRHWMTSEFGSPEQFAAKYPVALRISPIKVRGSSY
ncbi:TIGR03667 family PPOX class F420-dependent oxidoreductase [Ktedonosporobacter rubrisoli]|uniref:TIGR03667 family PPOX class F420-dependent oxidoreductase n=1 Tax=Ktedonosporobacter rubrisoli TaxID=2509675 RepID=A0A4P6JNR1_KTERU|nr:pyridoxamine 5'-phosphate oxidase family protein [Ktedonosporobacter rubrisoli]QBD76813.1 TIGR03667 family PPOX class F420-dependent oxidoreductase [Ktedonosporobacter rubrisoli]